MLVGYGMPAPTALGIVLAYSAGKATLQWMTQKVEKVIDDANKANANQPIPSIGGSDLEQLKKLVKLLKETHMSVCASAPASFNEVGWGSKGIIDGEVDFYKRGAIPGSSSKK